MAVGSNNEVVIWYCVWLVVEISLGKRLTPAFYCVNNHQRSQEWCTFDFSISSTAMTIPTPLQAAMVGSSTVHRFRVTEREQIQEFIAL